MLISTLPSENCPSEEHTLSRHAQTALATPIKSCCIACAFACLLSSPLAFTCTASGLREISTSCKHCNPESARSQCLPSQIVPLTPRLHDFESGYAYLLALIFCSIKRAFRGLWCAGEARSGGRDGTQSKGPMRGTLSAKGLPSAAISPNMTSLCTTPALRSR